MNVYTVSTRILWEILKMPLGNMTSTFIFRNSNVAYLLWYIYANTFSAGHFGQYGTVPLSIVLQNVLP